MAASFRSPRKIIRRLRLTPLAAGKIKNWPSFMFHYALGLKPRSPYVFRNGARIQIGRAIDHVPIIEIFLKEDYGKMPDDAVMIDLGANIGVFSIYAATTARNATVYAYEPFLEYFKLAEANARLNGQDDAVTCFNFAVAGRVESRTLYVRGTDFFFPTLMGQASRQSAEKIRVSCTTLAEIVESNKLDRVDMLKMDCEGAEYEILYPTPPIYLKKVKQIRMEYHNLDDQERNVGHLEKFLIDAGFTITRRQANSATNGNLWAVRQ
jgi:FkbM family methyltransferase